MMCSRVFSIASLLGLSILRAVFAGALCSATTSIVDAQQPGSPAALGVPERSMIVLDQWVSDAVRSNTTDDLSEQVDWETLSERISKGIDGDPKHISRFLTQSRGILTRWVEERHDNSREGSFHFMRVRMKKGEPQAVYRLVTPSGGANYAGLVLTTTASGSLRIIDFDDVASGEYFTQLSRRTLMRLMQATKEGVALEPTPAQTAFIQQTHELELLDRLVRDGKARGALLTYRTLQEPFKSDRRTQFLRFKAATQLEPGGAEQKEALDALSSDSKDRESDSFLRMNYFAQAGDFQSALTDAGTFARELGIDAWILGQMALFHHKLGHTQQARQIIDQAVELEPQLFEPHMTRMEIASAQSDFQAAVESLSRGDAIRPFHSLVRFETIPEAQGLIASAEYKQWKQERVSESRTK